jgi:hypothetical protein
MYAKVYPFGKQKTIFKRQTRIIQFRKRLNKNPARILFVTPLSESYLCGTFEDIYIRWVEAKGRKGDILIGLSTSGNSPNIVKALKVGQELGLVTIGMSGKKKSKMDPYCQYLLKNT